MLSDLLISLIGFIFRNFFLIVIVGALLSTVHHLMTQGNKDAILCKGPMVLYIIAVIAHIFLYWNLTEDPDLLVFAAQCLVPAFVALMIGGGVHEVNPDPRREVVAVAIAYGVSWVLSVLFTGWLVSILSLVLGLLLAGRVLTGVGKQQLMNMESQDKYGDSEMVQQLYKEGYRPDNYYRADEKATEARDNLRYHGVNPDE